MSLEMNPALSLIVALTLPCGAAEPPPPGSKPEVVKVDPPELPKPRKIQIDPSLPTKSQENIRKRLDEVEFQHLIDWEIEREDRKELVWPAPKGYSPKVAARKLEMRLIPRSGTLRAGDSFWYRIEIQNVGDRPAGIRTAAFLKGDGDADWTPFQFIITGPDGKSEEVLLGSKARYLKRGRSDPELHMTEWEEKNMVKLEDFDCGALGDAYAAHIIKTPDWSHLSKSQKDQAFREWSYRKERKHDLVVTLLPGETLVSRPWQYHACREDEAKRRFGGDDFPPPSGKFRELKTPYPFGKPGIYRLKVIFRGDAPDPPPSEAQIQIYLKRGATREKVAESHDRMQTFNPGILESGEVTVERLP